MTNHGRMITATLIVIAALATTIVVLSIALATSRPKPDMSAHRIDVFATGLCESIKVRGETIAMELFNGGLRDIEHATQADIDAIIDASHTKCGRP